MSRRSRAREGNATGGAARELRLVSVRDGVVLVPLDIEARVISNTRLSSDYNVIALEAPAIAATATPGQFVMVKPGHGTDPLLRRPFSVFEILEKDGRVTGLTLLSKRIGATTRLLYSAVEGDVVSCL